MYKRRYDKATLYSGEKQEIQTWVLYYIFPVHTKKEEKDYLSNSVHGTNITFIIIDIHKGQVIEPISV